MKIFQTLSLKQDGQGLVEYTLIIFLVTLVFWLAVKETAAGKALTDNWSRITACANAPFSCGS